MWLLQYVLSLSKWSATVCNGLTGSTWIHEKAKIHTEKYDFTYKFTHTKLFLKLVEIKKWTRNAVRVHKIKFAHYTHV